MKTITLEVSDQEFARAEFVVRNSNAVEGFNVADLARIALALHCRDSVETIERCRERASPPMPDLVPANLISGPWSPKSFTRSESL